VDDELANPVQWRLSEVARIFAGFDRAAFLSLDILQSRRDQMVTTSLRLLTRSGIVAVCALGTVGRGGLAQRVEWPAFAGDLAATKYSTLADINRDNVARLTKAWEWATNETPNAATHASP
jgi:hypothetical protein